MIFYLTVIGLYAVAAILMNHFVYAPRFGGMALWFNIVGVFASIVAVIAIDGIAATVCHKLQNRRFDPMSKYFDVSLRERNFLKKLNINGLKKIVPDLGALVKFPKGKILEPGSKEYIYLYLKESCSGEAGHIAGMILGFLIILIFPRYWFCFGLPTATVNFILSLLPVLLLRHNRYSLNSIYRKLLKKEERGAAASTAATTDAVKSD